MVVVICCIISNLLNLLRPDLFLSIWPVPENVLCVFKRYICVFCCQMDLHNASYFELVDSYINCLLFIFDILSNFLILSITRSEVLKYSIVIVEFFTSCSYVNFYFILGFCWHIHVCLWWICLPDELNCLVLCSVSLPLVVFMKAFLCVMSIRPLRSLTVPVCMVPFFVLSLSVC